MKVQVTLREIQYYESTEEIEMTVKEYNLFQKTGKLSSSEDFRVCNEFDYTGHITEGGHQITEQEIIEITK